MMRRKTVVKSLLSISVFVFVSIWVMTGNFPDRQCNCSKRLGSYIDSKRNVQDLDDKVAHDNLVQKFSTVPEFTTVTAKIQSIMTRNDEPSQPEVKVQTSAIPKEVKPKHKLAVIVPFRERLEELLEFVPYMSKFLQDQNIKFHIYVINQVDIYRFNRAALINVGFLTAVEDSCDYIAMHDVDLLPLNKNLSYGYPAEGPFHLSAPDLHPRYHYEKFIGGIMLMSNEHFKKVNGLSTLFWGWGREDDELYMRIQDAKLTIKRPVGITTGNKTFKHNHPKKRRRDYPVSRKQHKASFNRDRATGLNTMDHKVGARYELTIQGHSISMVTVELNCNKAVTPWCEP